MQSTLTQLPPQTLLAESVALAESLLHRWLSSAAEKPEPPTPTELQPAIHSLWKLSLIRKNLSPTPTPTPSPRPTRNFNAEVAFLNAGLTHLENELDAMERAHSTSRTPTLDVDEDEIDELEIETDLDAVDLDNTDGEIVPTQMLTRHPVPNIPGTENLSQLRQILKLRKEKLLLEPRPPPAQ